MGLERRNVVIVALMAGVLAWPSVVVAAARTAPDQRPDEAAVAAARHELASMTTIDKLVRADYERHKLERTRLTTDEQYLRRVYLDIVGRIPTYAEARAFLDSKDVDKRSKLVDVLIDSPGYASDQFNFWADVLRVQTRDRYDPTGDYAAWLKQAVKDNMAYDKFVYALLTATGSVRENGAAGYYLRDSGMPLDNAALTAQVFLGTQIGCAQCHDHPFDKWTQKDFYQFASHTTHVQTRGRPGGNKANAAQARELKKLMAELKPNERQLLQQLIRVNSYVVRDSDRPLTLPKDYKYDDAKPGSAVTPQVMFDGAIAPPKARGAELREEFAQWVISKDNPMFAKVIANRMWKKVMGLGLVEPVDDYNASTKPANPELLAFLTQEMVRLNFDLKAFQRMLYKTQTYQLASSESDLTAENYHAQAGVLRRMSAEALWDSLLTIAIENLDELEGPQSNSGRYAMLAKIDVANMTAQELVDTVKKAAANPRAFMADEKRSPGQTRRPDRARYDVQLVRASELPSPAPANHFLAQFGQSRRETPNDATSEPSVPQALAMLNGRSMDVLTRRDSLLVETMTRQDKPDDRVRIMWLSILSRYPKPEEMRLALEEVKTNGQAGYTNLMWALINSREFIFVQ